MVDDQAGWALTEEGVLRTSDGGATWQNVSPPDLRVAPDTHAFFLDRERGWVLAHTGDSGEQKGTLYATFDGGQTWRATRVPFGEAHLCFVASGGQTLGWALVPLGAAMSSEPVQIFFSPDDGQGWTLVSESENPQHPQPASGTLPFAGIKQGIAFRPDGQVEWEATEERTPDRVGLFRTNDQGRTWQRQAIPIPPRFRNHLLTVFPPAFTGNREGAILVLFHGPNSGYVVHTTTDGGNSWKPGSPVSRNDIQVSFVDARTGWAVETGPDKAQLLMTTDGGETWTRP